MRYDTSYSSEFGGHFIYKDKEGNLLYKPLLDQEGGWMNSEKFVEWVKSNYVKIRESDPLRGIPTPDIYGALSKAKMNGIDLSKICSIENIK